MYCPLFLIAIVAETRLIVSHTCGRKIWICTVRLLPVTTSAFSVSSAVQIFYKNERSLFPNKLSLDHKLLS
ncbi:hypothetical protein [Fischerella thermalis]|uniref:hypothetical protein n=1 Tax=Fischerella thermalis TaxID=372787 RepID=UPI0011AFABA6|nr:hypothetical protein [Fischerella thermalis]